MDPVKAAGADKQATSSSQAAPAAPSKEPETQAVPANKPAAEPEVKQQDSGAQQQPAQVLLNKPSSPGLQHSQTTLVKDNQDDTEEIIDRVRRSQTMKAAKE